MQQEDQHSHHHPFSFSLFLTSLTYLNIVGNSRQRQPSSKTSDMRGDKRSEPMEGEELGTSEGAVRISSSLVADHHDGHDTPPPLLSKQPRSNEYVLNVAFGSFLGFTILQFVFALVAHSQAMLADCAAMAVDALTYLFNYAAERLKHQNESKHPTDMDNTPPAILHRRKRLRRLYLELFPPLISVSTLAVVTALSLKEAISNIARDDDDENDEPDVNIMLLFSALNLVLDTINVSCFASADQAVGLVSFQSTSSQDDHDNEENGRLPNELSSLLKPRKNGQYEESSMYDSTAAETNMLDDDASSTDSADSLNLNMCSAWTHICADTLRSVAVLLAAGVAYLFPDQVSGTDADAVAAILVSVIIIISMGPLIQGIYSTAVEIKDILFEADRDYHFHQHSRRHFMHV